MSDDNEGLEARHAVISTFWRRTSIACHLNIFASQGKGGGHLSPAWDALGLLEDVLGSMAPAGELSQPSKLELRRLAGSFAGLAAAKVPESCNASRAQRKSSALPASVMCTIPGASRIHWLLLACKPTTDPGHPLSGLLVKRQLTARGQSGLS